MPEFFTLEEAARVLGLSADELKTKAQHREIRAFMDGGSWRFRKPDIEEEARRRGMGSDPDLSLSDLDLTTGPAIDFSEFQLGVADPDLAPESVEMPPQAGEGKGVEDDSGAHDILLDDRTTPPVPSGSASTIIGMSSGPGGKQPSDSDVKLLPEIPTGASDSDVRLGGNFGLSDSNVTLITDDLMVPDPVQPHPDDQETDPNATLAQPPHLGSSDDLPVASGESASDFELSPSSVIKSLEPESGSDFELTALDASSDEFDAAPLRSPGDSDVTGAGLSSSGVNLSRPSDSGINLLGPGAFDFNAADSIELAPLDDNEDEPRPKAKPDPAAAKTTPPAPAAKADLSATALPIKQEKDIFEDTDFEVDALDSGSGSDDQTVQLEAASDFDVEEQDDSASEVFAIDEDEVDQNAATAMAPSPRAAAADADDDDEDDEDSAWDMDEPATSSQAVRVAASPMFAQTAGQEWGGLWVGMLALATVFTLLLAFVGLDLVRNLYYFQGDGPASGLVRQLASLAGG